MLTVKRGAHLVVLASAFTVALLIVAQAKPSLYIEPPRALPDFHADITTMSFNGAAPLTNNKPSARETVGIGASAEERALFEAPDTHESANESPQQSEPAGRCTARSIVFAKMTLASACY